MTIVTLAEHLERKTRMLQAPLDAAFDYFRRMEAVMGGISNVARVLDDTNRFMRALQPNRALLEEIIAAHERIREQFATPISVGPWGGREPYVRGLAELESSQEDDESDESDPEEYWPGYL